MPEKVSQLGSRQEGIEKAHDGNCSVGCENDPCTFPYIIGSFS